MKNMPTEDLETRISVLETEHDYAQKTLDKLEEKMDINNETIMSIKERMDKQNGIIPRMAAQQDTLIEKFDGHLTKFNDHVLSEASVGLKIKIMWGIIATLSSGFVVAVIKIFLQ
jgi:uncharacterized coiled-coil protein SlyX